MKLENQIKQAFIQYLPGLLLVAIISASSVGLSKLNILQHLGMSALILAIFSGIVIGNTVYRYVSPLVVHGVIFSKSYILKLGIILYGLHLTFSQISALGIESFISDVFILGSTFLITFFFGHKILKLERESVILIGAGCSICGAAAILATESVMKARSEKLSIAVAVIVIFGTLAMFLYPVMYHEHLWSFNDKHWGVYIGSTVHEVAQVFAAGAAINNDVANLAVTTKMIRVMLLAPFLFVLSFWLNHHSDLDKNHQRSKIIVPWFAVGFIAMVAINSLKIIPEKILVNLLSFDNFILTMAMAALGLTTHLSDLKKAGLKPIILGAIVMIWLVMGGGLLQLALERY